MIGVACGETSGPDRRSFTVVVRRHSFGFVRNRKTHSVHIRPLIDESYTPLRPVHLGHTFLRSPPAPGSAFESETSGERSEASITRCLETMAPRFRGIKEAIFQNIKESMNRAIKIPSDLDTKVPRFRGNSEARCRCADSPGFQSQWIISVNGSLEKLIAMCHETKLSTCLGTKAPDVLAEIDRPKVSRPTARPLVSSSNLESFRPKFALRIASKTNVPTTAMGPRNPATWIAWYRPAYEASVAICQGTKASIRTWFQGTEFQKTD